MAEATCRECGCTDDDCSGCIARTGEPCSWTEPDLCSACAPFVPARPVKGEQRETGERCRYKPCPRPATQGAFVFPLDPPIGIKRWAFTLLCLPHGLVAVAKGARHISWRPQPGDRAQGSVEAELRENPEVMSSQAHQVYAGARAELRRRGHSRPTQAEISSEAIEAAEALGL